MVELCIYDKCYNFKHEFGNSKATKVGRKTWPFSGTSGYIALEITMISSHDTEDEHQSLGVLMCELLMEIQLNIRLMLVKNNTI